MADSETPPEASEQDKDRAIEGLKLYFDFFKHFTTLTTATALISIALQRQLNLAPEAPLAALFFWVFTLSQSLLGMGAILSQVVGASLLNPRIKDPRDASRLQQRIKRILTRLEFPSARDKENPFRGPGFWMWFLMINTVLSFFAGLFILVLFASTLQ